MNPLRALLLTDVVDSTRLTEELGDERMAALWTAHDRIARDLLPLWRGREIDKTDGMLLLFDAVTDAVGYALAYHRGLAEAKLAIRARAGIHVGPISLRPNPPADVARGAKPVEVDGLALPVAARVMSVASGGQTLLSADARLALGVAPQRIVSHGHWRMHGVADPVELFEIGEAQAPFAAPPDGAKVYRVVRQGDLWQPVREVRHSVPAERDSFVGRQDALQLIAKKLEDGARLISVLGIGGTGKTRLATRFAWTRIGDYPGGVWFCDLSQARTLDGIYFAVAQGLDVPLGKTDPVVQLAHAIAGRGECLLILDNFEQVARHAEETLGRWLERAPQARFIVTTREVLGIVGEETFALPTMPETEAVALFVRRAESAHNGYSPSSDDEVAIDQLVRVLDGLPLAIELAAARVRVFPPHKLLTLMSDRFRVLLSNGGRRDRQATLRAAFDWSWELLSEPEMAALAQLSVFEGGFTLESADAVLDLSACTDRRAWTSDLISNLVDKSLVRQQPGDRFDLLESVREYAAEHLGTEGRYPGSGKVASTAAQSRHWRYFAGLDEKSAIRNGCVDANNLVAACRRALDGGDSKSAVEAMATAWAALKLTGPFQVAAQLAASVAKVPDLPDDALMMVAWVAGNAHHNAGQTRLASGHIAKGRALAQAKGDMTYMARFDCLLAEALADDGRSDEAMKTFNEAMTIAEDLGDRLLLCRVQNGLGALCSELARPREALSHYTSALDLARREGDPRWTGGLLGNLGILYHAEGRLTEAFDHYQEAISLARTVGNRRWQGNSQCNLGLLLFEKGDVEEATLHLQSALLLAREMGHRRLESTVLCNLGLVAWKKSNLVEARTWLESAVSLAHELADRRSEGIYRTHLGELLGSVTDSTEATQCFSVAEQLLLQAGDPSSLALMYCKLAELDHRWARTAQADAALAEASVIALKLQLDAHSELSRALTHARSTIESREQPLGSGFASPVA